MVQSTPHVQSKTQGKNSHNMTTAVETGTSVLVALISFCKSNPLAEIFFSPISCSRCVASVFSLKSRLFLAD